MYGSSQIRRYPASMTRALPCCCRRSRLIKLACGRPLRTQSTAGQRGAPEYDTGSENLPRLAAKLEDYGRLAEALAQVEEVCPPLLFTFLTPRREQAARRMLAGCQDAAALRVATTALDPQVTCPAGPVWLPLTGGHSGQVRLIDLDAAMPDPWQHYREQQARLRRQRERDARAARPGWMHGDDDVEDPSGP
jgi:hypothetical protein